MNDNTIKQKIIIEILEANKYGKIKKYTKIPNFENKIRELIKDHNLRKSFENVVISYYAKECECFVAWCQLQWYLVEEMFINEGHDRIQAMPEKQRDFLESFVYVVLSENETTADLSLFCYDNDKRKDILSAMQKLMCKHYIVTFFEEHSEDMDLDQSPE